MRAGIAVVDWLCFGLTALFSLYMAISAFRFLQYSPQHYSTLMLVIVVVSALLALRNVLMEGQERRGLRFHVRLTLAALTLAAGLVSGTYVRLNALRLQIEQPFLNDLDVVMGGVLLAAVLLANWFLWGTVLTVVIAGAIVYFFWGHLIGDAILRHPPYDVPFVMTYMGMNGTEGLFAYLPDGVEKLYFLVIFSAVLIGSGMVDLVIEMGKAMGRYVRGGAAFPAIVGSTMVGTVMGAAVSNVILTGRLTIPMMKRYGFRSEIAGAIEASASTASQIIPPVMGLAAFIMAALLNIPYITIALIAVIPSLLYMTGVTIAVLVHASRDGLPRLQESVNPAVFRRLLPTFVLPFLVVLVLMLLYYSPSIAGLAGIGAALLLCPLQGALRPSPRQFLTALKDGFATAMGLNLLLVAIGPLSQTFVTTNLAGRLSAVLIKVLPDDLLVLLLGAMVLALLAGMGLPTPAAYVLVALTLAHFLQSIRVEAIPAHFFIQYFAVFSALTPPVALASLAAATVAQAPFMTTARESLKLVLPAFIIPFAFIYHPSLLTFPNMPASVLLPIAAVIGLQAVGAMTFYGYFFRPLGRAERAVFGLVGVLGAGALLQTDPVFLQAFVASAAAGLLWVWLGHRLQRRRARLEPAPEAGVPGDPKP